MAKVVRVGSSKFSRDGLLLRIQPKICSLISELSLGPSFVGKDIPARFARTGRALSSISWGLLEGFLNHSTDKSRVCFFSAGDARLIGNGTPARLASAISVGSERSISSALFSLTQFVTSSMKSFFFEGVRSPCGSGTPDKFAKVGRTASSTSSEMGFLFLIQSIEFSMVRFFSLVDAEPRTGIGNPARLTSEIAEGSSKSIGSGCFFRIQSTILSISLCRAPGTSKFSGMGMPARFARGTSSRSSTSSGFGLLFRIQSRDFSIARFFSSGLKAVNGVTGIPARRFKAVDPSRSRGLSLKSFLRIQSTISLIVSSFSSMGIIVCGISTPARFVRASRVGSSTSSGGKLLFRSQLTVCSIAAFFCAGSETSNGLMSIPARPASAFTSA